MAEENKDQAFLQHADLNIAFHQTMNLEYQLLAFKNVICRISYDRPILGTDSLPSRRFFLLYMEAYSRTITEIKQKNRSFLGRLCPVCRGVEGIVKRGLETGKQI